ncbi:MAG TPA: YqaE/Pmp3 family membrane protein [Segetibacter sp.]|jgi:uncharacterized membrane protein YqaE (UPF0057 family)
MKKNLLLFAFLFFISDQSFSAFVTDTKSKPAETNVNPNGVTNVPAATDVKAAMEQFNSLSKSERKDKFKEVKKQLRELKAERKANSAPSTNTALLVILAILLPPLAVFLHQGEINTKFWISLLLTLLFFLPGVIYALLVVLGEA